MHWNDPEPDAIKSGPSLALMLSEAPSTIADRGRFKMILALMVAGGPAVAVMCENSREVNRKNI